MDLMIWMWGGLVVATLIVEFATDQLVSIWFSVGAVASLVVAICDLPEWLQISVFLAVSAIALLLSRKFVKKILNKPTEPTNADTLIGQTTKLITSITKDEYGTVKFDGVVWNAVSENKDEIGKDEKIVVCQIKGNKLVVKKAIEEKEEK